MCSYLFYVRFCLISGSFIVGRYDCLQRDCKSGNSKCIDVVFSS